MDISEINEEELLQAVVTAIEDIPGAHVNHINRRLSSDRHRRSDVTLDMSIAHHKVRLIIEAKREAFPRDIREFLWQLRNYDVHGAASDHDVIPFIVARSISRGARDLLREESVGFCDLGGALFIPGRSVYVMVDRPPPKRARQVASIFEGQRARTTIILFAHRNEWVGVNELAKLADVSTATAWSTLKEMERHDWVDVDGSGPSKVRRLRNPKALLDEWAAYIVDQKLSKPARYYVPIPDIVRLSERLAQACRSNDLLYAVTSEVAAQHYAPYLSTISRIHCRMVPGPVRDRVLEEIKAKRVSEGWNLAILETRGEKDIIVDHGSRAVAFAPPLQVYLDLLHGSGRAKEMAAHLRKERLGA